jgi:isoamyl acetate esterase
MYVKLCLLACVVLLLYKTGDNYNAAYHANYEERNETVSLAGQLLTKNGIIVFFGDSITEQGTGRGGYVNLVKKALEEKHPELSLTVLGAGISGNKVDDLLRRMERDVLARKPTLVVVYIGINDVGHSAFGQGTDKNKYESGLRVILGTLAAKEIKGAICTPSVIGEKSDGTNELDQALDEYAQIVRRVAGEMSVPVCDLRKAFIDYLKKNNSTNFESGILTADGVHLNSNGNKLVAEEILRLLAAD